MKMPSCQPGAGLACEEGSSVDYPALRALAAAGPVGYSRNVGWSAQESLDCGRPPRTIKGSFRVTTQETQRTHRRKASLLPPISEGVTGCLLHLEPQN